MIMASLLENCQFWNGCDTLKAYKSDEDVKKRILFELFLRKFLFLIPPIEIQRYIGLSTGSFTDKPVPRQSSPVRISRTVSGVVRMYTESGTRNQNSLNLWSRIVGVFIFLIHAFHQKKRSITWTSRKITKMTRHRNDFRFINCQAFYDSY